MRVLKTTSSSSQSAWIAALSDSDVEMHVSTSILSFSTALPLFATSSTDKSLHVIDSGATIHCTPYRDMLFNVHSAPTILLTVANSEQLVMKLAGDMVLEVK